MLAGVSTRKFAQVGEPVGEEVEAFGLVDVEDAVSEMFVERTRTALGELDGPPAGGRQVGGDDARRPGDRRPHARRRAGDHDGGRQDPARALGGHRRRTPRSRGRCWPISSTAAWIPTRRSCSSSTAARRSGGRSATSSASTRWCIAAIATRRGMSPTCCPTATAIRSRRPDARGVVADGRRPGRAAPAAARVRARPHVARRGRLAARRHGRHAHADAARDHRQPRPDAVLDEPLREHDRDRPLHPTQRQALARRRHAQTLDAAGMLVAEQQFRRIIGYRDLASSSSPSNVTTTPSPRTTRPVRRTATRHRLTISPRRSPSKFHDDPDNLRCIARSMPNRASVPSSHSGPVDQGRPADPRRPLRRRRPCSRSRSHRTSRFRPCEVRQSAPAPSPHVARKPLVARWSGRRHSDTALWLFQSHRHNFQCGPEKVQLHGVRL